MNRTRYNFSSQIPDSSRGLKNIEDLLDCHILTFKSRGEGEDPTILETRAREHKFKGLWHPKEGARQI